MTSLVGGGEKNMSELQLPFKPGFSIEPAYALLLGEVQIIYSRFELTIVDIICFYVKNYRNRYYIHESIMPKGLLDKLVDVIKDIEKQEDGEALARIKEGFERAVDLRNAIDHSVPCWGPSDYDVLHFQQGIMRKGYKKPPKNLNIYRGVCFDYERLLQEGKLMESARREASIFFYSLRERARNGEIFPGDPC